MEINITLVWQLALFMGLFAWLSSVLFRPLMTLFEEREHRIEHTMTDSKELHNQAEALEHQAQALLEEAKRGALNDLHNVQRDSKKQYEQALLSAKGHAKQLVDSAVLDLERQSKTLQEQLQEQAPYLSNQIIHRLFPQVEHTPMGPSESKMECFHA